MYGVIEKENKVCARIIISVMRNKWNLIIVEKYTMILCSVCTSFCVSLKLRKQFDLLLLITHDLH